MVIHWIFLSWWISCPVSKYQKSTRKSWIFDLSLASNFDQSPTSEKLELENLFCRWILEIWTWNLRGYISHVVAKKSLSIAPWRRNEEREAELSLSHRKQKEVTEKSKAKRSSNQIKRVKENAWMLKLGEVC